MIIYINIYAVSKQNNLTYILMIIYINFNAVSKQNNFTYIFDDNLHKILCSFQTK